MTSDHQPPGAADGQLRTALFLDFDNIYIGLKEEEGEDVAKRFATAPGRWLEWLEQGMPEPGQPRPAGGPRRRILLRNCYLNPVGRDLPRYRASFTATGFRVVDCPTLTRQGKNSADILMVMDILDALSHPTRFDEFILFSGDADFTAVLLRLRAHDRRTVALSVGQPSTAYASACDRLLTVDELLEGALGGAAVSAVPAVPATVRKNGPEASASLFTAMAEKLRETAAPAGMLPSAELVKLYRSFAPFTRSKNWLGHGGLRSLTEYLISLRPELRLAEGNGAWGVEVVRSAGAPSAPATTVDSRYAGLREEILDQVRQIVRGAERPVTTAGVASQVTRRLGDDVLRSEWAGAGTFKDLLAGAPDLGIAVETGMGGVLYDPARHARPEAERPVASRQNVFAESYPDLAELALLVHQATNTPRLTPPEYAAVFRATAAELAENPEYRLNTTSKAVRDRCLDQDCPVSRGDVTFVLRGISFTASGFRPREGMPYALALAESFKENVFNLCQGAQYPLADGDRDKIDRWIVGGLRTTDAAAPQAAAETVPEPPAGTAAVPRVELAEGLLFEGPFEDPKALKDEPGVWVVGDLRGEGEWFVLDVGETERVRSAVQGHERIPQWAAECQGRVVVAALYTPPEDAERRRAVERQVREKYLRPVGTP